MMIRYSRSLEDFYVMLTCDFLEALQSSGYCCHHLHLIFSQEIVLKSLNKKDNFLEAVVTVKINSMPEDVNTKIFKIDNHYLCIA